MRQLERGAVNNGDKLALCSWVAVQSEGSPPAPGSAEQVSSDGPIELMKKVLLASHLQLARSLNLWHVLAGSVNKLKLPLQANPALYVSSQLWTCHLFLLYGIFKSIEKSLLPSPPFFFTLSFLSVPHFLEVSPSSDHSSLFWLWKKKKKAERKERDTLTGLPFVRLMVWGRRRRRERASTGWRCCL